MDLDELVAAVDKMYPRAGSAVDGRAVMNHIPNTSSITGYFREQKTLRDVRVMPMSAFGGPRTVFYAKNDYDRSERLAEGIRASREINPLIIGVDTEGPFIIEGAHRYVALYNLKAKCFPALVVVGLM